MADSENSRTLPSKRYRNLLDVAACLLSEMAAKKGGAYGPDSTAALVRWVAWWEANADYSQLCRVQQRLEDELLRTAATHQPVPLATSRSLDPSGPERVPMGKALTKIEPNVAFCGREWRRGSDVRHRRAKAAEDAASAREERLAEELWSVPGESSVSAMAKLHCLLEQGEPAPDSPEFPWPQIRSALADLLAASSLDATNAADLRSGHSITPPL